MHLPLPFPIHCLFVQSKRAKVPILGLLNERVEQCSLIDPIPRRRNYQGRLLETLNRGISVIVYPEGTRSKDGELLPFKRGPFIWQLSHGQPSYRHIHGTRLALPKGGLLMRKNSIHIRFGPPLLPPTGDDARALQAFVEEGQQSVARMKAWHLAHINTPD